MKHVWSMLLLVLGQAAFAQDAIEAGKFSTQKPGGTPQDWKPLTFRNIDKHSTYTLATENGVMYSKPKPMPPPPASRATSLHSS